jgi:SecD/SecF fusion protein
MVENVARKVLFVSLALLASLALILIPDRPFQMGLDLQGGTRLVYRFDLDDVPSDPQGPSGGQDPGEVLNQVVGIIRNRVDPTGVRDAVIRREGFDRIVIELPGTPDISGNQAFSTLQGGIDVLYQISLDLAPEEAAQFPETGGTIQIGEEKIHYEKRVGATLQGLNRGHRATDPAAHAAGDPVQLASDDAIKDLIENLGDLTVNIQATAGDFAGTETDLTKETEKLDAWLAENPNASITGFNDVAPEDGGPIRPSSAEGAEHPGLMWVVAKAGEGELRTERERAVPLLVQANQDLRFAGADLDQVYPSTDRSGFPAVGFETKPNRKGDFGRLTGSNVDRLMVITLNGVAESIATINEKLPGQGIIMGRFSNQEVNDLITVIRSGSLPIRPTLEHEEVVGPTLGHDYVRRGFLSALIAIAAVIVFMAFYYRRLGLFAAVALVANLVMLLGGLAFLQATLTLPGIAGIILTVGMAVDANILIFDRIREEMDKGQNVKQAARTGFEKAFSAIFDANLTTLITALILYKIGTGPVRGFAVTLSIGIIASMISALVITRLLVHVALERGVKAFPMGTWMVTANYKFLDKAKLAFMVSAVAIVAAVVGFAVRPSGDKFGIDFLGGGEVQIRTEEPQDVDVVRAMVAEIPGAIGDSAEVKPVLASAEGDRYDEFRIAFKVTDEHQADEGAEQSLKREIATYLDPILQKGPIEVGEATHDGAQYAWPVTLYFVDEHPVQEVKDKLTDTEGIASAELTQDASRPTVYSGTVRAATSRKVDVESSLTKAFNRQVDTNGTEFDLSQPIPSSSLVGPQVVGELRNKAVIALFVSLFAIVLYIRVRFAEYSYGVAAVAAVVHDVLVTLGLLTLADVLGIINGEMTLPMVAAFLTIVGYSLNDTIVIFDRVRENLPRMKRPLGDVLEISINQTLSRTVLTSGTTLIAVLILFGFNVGTGNTLEGFSFAMICGVLTGTYSTIFIANPVLLWLENRADRKGRGARAHLAAEKRQREERKGDDKAMGTT